ncbi:MAG: LysM peptidoglycan-binding domain-containing protein [Anaerovoracaceae bacterium]
MTHNKKYIIKSKFRFTVFMVIVLLCISGLLSTIFANSLTEQQYQQIEVTYGDTLWSIAESYMPTDQDIRKSIYEITKLNQVSADTLQSGQTLLIPVYAE